MPTGIAMYAVMISACGLLAACSLGGGTEKDATADAVLREFCDAIKSNNTSEARSCFTTPEDAAAGRILEANLVAMAEHYRLKRVVNEKLGESGRGIVLPSIVDEIESRLAAHELRAEGDRAILGATETSGVSVSPKPPGAGIELVRGRSGWKVDTKIFFGIAPATEPALEELLPMAERMTVAMRETARDVESGRLTTARDVRLALGRRTPLPASRP